MGKAPIYVLVGGQSKRFGENKAHVSIFGEPLIVRLANQLASEYFPVTLVAQHASDYMHFGLPTIEDGALNCGPLQGMLAALQDCHHREEPWCWITNCDILEWNPEWRSIFLQTRDLNPDLEAIVLSGSNDMPGEFRPLPGLYRSSLYREVAALRNAGESSLRALHQRIRARIGVCRVDPKLLPRSFNTRQELSVLLENPLN